MSKKGISAALTVVITIVVLVVVALAVITMVTQNVGQTGTSSAQQTGGAFDKIGNIIAGYGDDEGAGTNGGSSGSSGSEGIKGGSCPAGQTFDPIQGACR
jgi:flagellar basal body-associated protein FliL